MSLPLHNCWACGKKLLKFKKETPFHCSTKCQMICPKWSYKAQKVKWDLDSLAPKKEAVETSSPRTTKNQKTCGNCGQKGHNRRTCKH